MVSFIKKNEKRPEKILERIKIDKMNVSVNTLLKSTKNYYDANVGRYKNFYDEGLKEADAETREGYEKLEEVLSKTVNPKEVILDVGCGVGRWSVLMAKKDALIIGIDQSKEMLQECRKRAILNGVSSNIILLRINAMKLPFLDNFFDGVALNWVIAHIPVSKNVDFMKEIARVVKPDGWLVLSDSYWRNQGGGKEQLQIREASGKKFKVYKYYYSPDELRELIKKTFGYVESMYTTAKELIFVARKRKNNFNY
jgi:putative AdoMet-dependent methyltransferase